MLNAEDMKFMYERDIRLYQSLCREFVAQLEEIFTKEGIKTLFPIDFRVKELVSILEKIERNQLQITKLSDINDLAGIRIILLFRDDVAKVCKIIEENFQVLRNEDTQQRLTDDRFGYASVHFEVTPQQSWLSVPTLSKLDGLVAEIQVRTASQHIWAAASHLLQYKQESHVPVPMRRTINRISALLETVDLEFNRILHEREEYVFIPMERNDELDIDKLRVIMDETLPAINKKESSEDYGLVFNELDSLGVRTVGEVESLIARHLEEAVERDEFEVWLIVDFHESENKELSMERVLKGVFYSHTGLMRYMIRVEIGETWDEKETWRSRPKAGYVRPGSMI